MSRLRNTFLFILVLACALSIWWVRQDPRDSSPPPAAPAPARAVAAATAPPPESLHVVVLNGTKVSGLARRTSRLLPALGCVALEVGDAPHDTFSRTILVNRRLSPERARALAAQLANPVLVNEWDPRGDEDAILVLGRDHGRVLAALEGAP